MFLYIAKGLWFWSKPSRLIAPSIGYGRSDLDGLGAMGPALVSIGAICCWSPAFRRWLRPDLAARGSLPQGAVDDVPPPPRALPFWRRRGYAGRRGAWRAGAERGGERMVEAVTLAAVLRGEDRVFGRRCRHSQQSGSRSRKGRAPLTRRQCPIDRLDPRGKVADTYENVVYLKEEFNAMASSSVPPSVWLLITSAYHMPRAMGAFR